MTQVSQGSEHGEQIFELFTNSLEFPHDVQVVDVVTQVKQLASHFKH